MARASRSENSQHVVFRGKTGLPLFLILTGVVCLGFGLFMTSLGLPQPDKKDGMSWGGFLVIALLFTGGVGGLGLWLILWPLPYLGLRVEVDADGVTVRRWYGTTQLGWETLEAFWWNADKTYLEGRRSGASVYTLVDLTGKRLRLRSEFIDNGRDLGPVLEEYVGEFLTPVLSKKLQRGKEIDFGPLTVTPEGLVYKDKELSWDEVAEIGLRDGGEVVVQQQDGWSTWFRSPMSRIPNIPVLFQIVGQRLVRTAVQNVKEEPEAASAPARAASPLWKEDEITREELADLGTPIHVCESKTSVKEGYIGAVIAFVIAGVTAVVVLYGAFVGNWFTSPTLPVHVVLLLAAAFVGIVVWGGFTALGMTKKGGQSLHVYDHGFAHVNPKRVWVCPWDRVARSSQSVLRTLQAGQYAGTWYSYTIARDDEELLTITDEEVKKIARFGEELVKRTHDRLFREARAALQAGEAVRFGAVELNKKGIRVHEELVPWSQFAGAQMSEGSLIVSSTGKKDAHQVLGMECANLSVLLQLLEQIARTRSAK